MNEILLDTAQLESVDAMLKKTKKEFISFATHFKKYDSVMTQNWQAVWKILKQVDSVSVFQSSLGKPSCHE